MTKSPKEMAEKAFEGLGGRHQEHHHITGPTQWALPDGVFYIHNNKPISLITDKQMVKWVYSWPMPTCLGLIIEDARKRGWGIDLDDDERFVLFMQYVDKKLIETTTYYFKKNENPMPAVVAAYCELLDIDARQGEEVG